MFQGKWIGPQFPLKKIESAKVDTIGGKYSSSESGARLEIFPDSNTGLVIYDDAETKVLEVLVDGTDVGDAIIGNFAGNTGLKYDKSAGTFTFLGILVQSLGGGTSPLPVYRGVYDAGTSYYKGDWITYGGSAWLYINVTPGAGHTPANDDYWDVFSSVGATGATGAAGAVGPGIAYRGLHNASTAYYNTAVRKDVVSYGGVYYIYKGTSGEAHAWVAGEWDSFGATFSSIATGLLLAEDATITQTLTMGSAVADGIIQSYGYNGTVPGYQLLGGATPSMTFIGGTIRTDTGAVGHYKRIELDPSDNTLRMYDSNNVNVIKIDENIYNSMPGIWLENSDTGATLCLKKTATEYLYLWHDAIELISDAVTGHIYAGRSANGYGNIGCVGAEQFLTSTGKLFTGIANSVLVFAVDHLGNIALAGTVDGRDVSVDGAKLDGIAAGATVGATWSSNITNQPSTFAPSAHNLIDGTGHPVSGLTSGHFLKATGATTYDFGVHGLTYSDVGAAASGHNHSGTYIPVGGETDPTIFSWAKAEVKPAYTYSEVGAAPSSTVSFPGFGITDALACVGNDSRLSDARTPIAHNQAWSTITTGVPTTLSGYGITDATPSSHVGAGGAAHADASIDPAVAGFMTAAQASKLYGIEAGADITDATNVTAAGAVMTESDPTIYAWAKAATKPAYTYSEVGAAPSSTVSFPGFGTSGTTACVGNDSRLSDARPGLNGISDSCTVQVGGVNYTLHFTNGIVDSLVET